MGNILSRLVEAVKRKWRWRSSITGRWVSKTYAEKNPRTTQREKQ